MSGNWLAEGAYDDVLFWAEGVRKMKATDAENIIKTLENIEADGVRGKIKVDALDHCSHISPYKKGFVEECVKAIAEAPLSEITDRLKKAHAKFGYSATYGIYPYGPLAPLSQWQNDGRMVLLWPPEVMQKTNPGQGYVSLKDLRAKQK